MIDILDVVAAVESTLSRHDVPHAFGGAIALGFHIGEPRATRDVDLNVFVPAKSAESTFTVLPSEFTWTERDVAEVIEKGQVRLFWDDTPVDLFFATHAFHEYAAEHAETAPLAGMSIPILGANELAIFKAFFDRTRDWADIEAMVDSGSLDLHVVIGWMVDLVGGDDHRVARLRSLLERPPPGEEPRFTP
jgi:hypothetical protein